MAETAFRKTTYIQAQTRLKTSTMLLDILVNSFAVLLISFLIAKKSQINLHYRITDAKVSYDLTQYLFGGNRAGLATSSNIGSILSIAMVFSFLLVAIRGWGLMAIFAVLLGLLIGYAFLMHVVSKVHNPDTGEFEPSLLYANFVDRASDERSSQFIRSIVIVEYFCFLTLEFTVLTSFLKGIFPDSTLSSLAIVLLISFLCATYTSTGGYKGILRTDLFQVMVFVAGFIYVIFKMKETTAVLIAENISLSNIVPVDPLQFITAAIIVALFSSSFPDVWIRNVSSLRVSLQSKRTVLTGSFIIMALLLMPYTLLSLPVLDSVSEFSREFDTGATVLFYIGLFRESVPLDAMSVWYFVAAFVCIFITTIDTWLIGIMQHNVRREHVRNPYRVFILPYIFAVVAALAAYCVTAKEILLIGIITFQFLFFNHIWIISTILRKPKYTTNWLYGTLATGLLATVIMVFCFWDELALKAPSMTLTAAMLQYLYLFTINRLKGTTNENVSL